MSEYEYDDDRAPAGTPDYSMKQKCLPTYLVVDASGSMRPHEDLLNITLERVHTVLSNRPRISEFAHMAIVAFAGEPQMVISMTDLENVPVMPRVVCSGTTNYSAVFDLLRNSIDDDVDDLIAQDRAVLRPAVFFFTDGAPTDHGWETAFKRLVDTGWRRHPHVITYGFGDAPAAVLGKVATKAAFLAESDIASPDALTNAINSMLVSLVASSKAEALQIPQTADGYVTIPIEYM